ncbi:MAG: FecR family protein [Pseudobacter sp.]|uniref:FecR family protein n=1 Tax=Pseudobacter sp. TaxID=2045420 RepID=UPI003F7FF04C
MLDTRMQILIGRIADGSAVPADYHEMAELLQSDQSGTLAAALHERLSAGEQEEPFDVLKWQQVANGILAADKAALKPVRGGGFLRKLSWAAIFVLVAGSIVFWLQRKNQKPEEGRAIAVKDINAGSSGAILQLADGSTIVLDSMQNGVVAQQQRTTVVLQDGSIRYNASGISGDETAFNTMIVPRGRQYRITLPDGSDVWLNAASSIRYPVAFAKDQRIVELTGEAYFSVKKDMGRPFHVKVNNRIEVEVLGTAFNVNAYENEQRIATTLLEGSVKVLNTTAPQPKWTILKPGQQSLSTGQHQEVLNEVDTDKTIAWKNGLFNFNGAGLHEVMRQLERWYDIEVEYEGKVPDMKFEGKITRGVSLKGVLSGLEKSEVRFRLEGRKLIVKP